MATTNGSNATATPSTDPSIYDQYKSQFSSLPTTPSSWLQRAQEVSLILSRDAAIREQENKSPVAEIALLKHSGLMKALGPKKYGGGAQPWSVGYQLIREVAKGDGSLGMLLGYHLLWSTTAEVVGSPEQAERWAERIVGGNLFVGGAVNPRDGDLKITADGDSIVFMGMKRFNTGGVISDVTVLERVLEGTEDHMFAIVPTDQKGIVFGHDWDNVGLRLTESGSVRIENVRVPWADALGWDTEKKRPDPKVLGIPFATLLLPTIQLVFSNFYIGIAWGALEAAIDYTNKNTRAWPFGGDKKDSAQEEFYILSTYGNFLAHLRAATALADVAATHLDTTYASFSGDPVAKRANLTARQRGEVAEWVVSVKIAATDTALRVTSGIFETTGAKATARKVGLDRFWRDIRTHTLHDPVAYKNRELGRYQLVGEVPEPTWYT
ncbi:dibenzothiophene desulfurization enzyme C [Pseudomassariella vexata]|uniref:Dibenzothiophene desulfurization enzyme C n=1 Tax=Pseudomassariella vexata TaxID=1141098 RepID=A0A1Y2E7Z0_9PEZI|nr:dibenzothiophene desulfurization enzyme C [Pseudomassariella vexata]ORY67681.1 dibenzothiophene desulfurization enzyme C [Pseudomassariella vexata]